MSYFKLGSYVKCVNTNDSDGELTLNKIYKVVKIADNGYNKDQVFIVNDKGFTFGYFYWRFRKCEEKRVKQYGIVKFMENTRA